MPNSVPLRRWMAAHHLDPDGEPTADAADAIRALRAAAPPRREPIRGGGYAGDAWEAALWCLARDGGSFEKGVLLATNLGDDTDTVAAIYAQLAGGLYGLTAIPAKWLRRVSFAPAFGALATELTRMAVTLGEPGGLAVTWGAVSVDAMGSEAPLDVAVAPAAAGVPPSFRPGLLHQCVETVRLAAEREMQSGAGLVARVDVLRAFLGTEAAAAAALSEVRVRLVEAIMGAWRRATTAGPIAAQLDAWETEALELMATTGVLGWPVSAAEAEAEIALAPRVVVGDDPRARAHEEDGDPVAVDAAAAEPLPALGDDRAIGAAPHAWGGDLWRPLAVALTGASPDAAVATLQASIADATTWRLLQAMVRVAQEALVCWDHDVLPRAARIRQREGRT
jgi:hypothetical protein